MKTETSKLTFSLPLHIRNAETSTTFKSTFFCLQHSYSAPFNLTCVCMWLGVKNTYICALTASPASHHVLFKNLRFRNDCYYYYYITSHCATLGPFLKALNDLGTCGVWKRPPRAKYWRVHQTSHDIMLADWLYGRLSQALPLITSSWTWPITAVLYCLRLRMHDGVLENSNVEVFKTAGLGHWSVVDGFFSDLLNASQKSNEKNEKRMTHTLTQQPFFIHPLTSIHKEGSNRNCKLSRF